MSFREELKELFQRLFKIYIRLNDGTQLRIIMVFRFDNDETYRRFLSRLK